MSILNWIKRQIALLRAKQSLIKENEQLYQSLNFELNKYMPLIEELDQNKVYYIVIENDEEAKQAYGCWNELIRRLKWTSCPMVILPNKINQLSEEQLQSLLRKARANKIKK